MKFKKKIEDKQESPFDHQICKACSKVGHRMDMTTIPGQVWQDWCDTAAYAKYGDHCDSIRAIKVFNEQPEYVYVHKDCAPLRCRELFGGWELTEAGKARLAKLRNKYSVDKEPINPNEGISQAEMRRRKLQSMYDHAQNHIRRMGNELGVLRKRVAELEVEGDTE